MGKRKETLGLKSFSFILPEKDHLETLKERLKKNSVEFTEAKDSITLFDPWNNQLTMTVKSK